MTTAYTRGLSATTPLSYTRQGNTVTVTVGATCGRWAGQPARRAVVVELPDTMRATKATLNGKPLPLGYDAATDTNIIKLPARPIGQVVAVVVQAKAGG